MFVLRRPSLLISLYVFQGMTQTSCVVGMFRFKFNEIDGIQKACLKTYIRQKWFRQVIVHQLFTSTSCQHLGSSRFFMGSMLLILLVFRTVYLFYFACLSTLYLFGKYSCYIVLYHYY